MNVHSIDTSSTQHLSKANLSSFCVTVSSNTEAFISFVYRMGTSEWVAHGLLEGKLN